MNPYATPRTAPKIFSCDHFSIIKRRAQSICLSVASIQPVRAHRSFLFRAVFASACLPHKLAFERAGTQALRDIEWRVAGTLFSVKCIEKYFTEDEHDFALHLH
jgi:hypothetical protein